MITTIQELALRTGLATRVIRTVAAAVATGANGMDEIRCRHLLYDAIRDRGLKLSAGMIARLY